MILNKWLSYYLLMVNHNNYDQVLIKEEIRIKSISMTEMTFIKEEVIIGMTETESTKCKWQSTISNIITNYTEVLKMPDIQ